MTCIMRTSDLKNLVTGTLGFEADLYFLTTLKPLFGTRWSGFFRYQSLANAK